MIHFNSSKILIPVDFSETSQLAIKHGAFIAQLTKGDLYLLHVINAQYMAQNMFVPLIQFNAHNNIEDKAEVKLAQLVEEVKTEYNLKIQFIVKSGNPSTEIVSVAKEIGASLIIMGTHGYSPLEELVIGSTALKVLTKSVCPTMAMSGEADHKGYSRILLPIDTSAHTRQKVNYTLEMAKKFSATVHAVAILGAGEESEKPSIELIMHQIEKLAHEKNVAFHSDVISNVKNRATATVNYSQKTGADMIVIMTDQDAELSGFFLGPYAQQVIHLSKVPVIAIKPMETSSETDMSILSGTAGI
jgi:nucleotide-binding universal stress UspA family protein